MNQTYIIDVDGIGQFEVYRRNMRMEIASAAEYVRLTEGMSNPAPWFAALCSALSMVKTRVKTAPDGFVVDDMDPLDSDSFDAIRRVQEAILEKDASFRQVRKGAGKAGGAGSVADSGVVVQEPV